MRILLLASSYYPHLGGVEEVVRQTARAYDVLGHAVLVVAPRWPRSLPSSENADHQLVLRVSMPMPSRHPRSAASFALRFLPSVVRTLYIGLRWRPDVIHVHCVGPNGLYALILSWLLRFPLIVTTHGEQRYDANRVYQKSRMQRWILRRLLQRAAGVTAPSRDALQALDEYGLRQGSALIIPNGVDLDEFEGSPAPLHRHPYIFAVGRHVWNKGFDVLLHAFAEVAPRYPDLDLIMAGDGPDHQRLVTLAGTLGIANRVVFPRQTTRVMTVAYLHHAWLVVAPSLQESFGLVSLEGMAARRPVIATRTGGVPDVIEDGCNGLLVPPGDSSALATSIQALLDGPETATRLAETGARVVREKYRWDTVAHTYLHLYRRILGDRGVCQDAT